MTFFRKLVGTTANHFPQTDIFPKVGGYNGESCSETGFFSESWWVQRRIILPTIQTSSNINKQKEIALYGSWES